MKTPKPAKEYSLEELELLDELLVNLGYTEDELESYSIEQKVALYLQDNF